MRYLSLPSTIRATALPTACILGIALSLAGCYGDRAAYPDTTTDTRIRADEIRADNVRRTTAISTDLAQREREYDFRIAQVKDRNVHDRSVIELERDQKIGPVDAQEREAKAAGDRAQADIDAELSAKSKQADGTEEARLKADAATRKAAVVLVVAEGTAKRTSERDRRLADAREATLAIDTREAKEIAAIQKEREITQQKARADALAVDADATKRLDGLGKDSKTRMDERSEVAADRLAQDRNTDEAIRKVLDSDRTKSGNVAFTADRGSVVLSGEVANEAIRQDIVSRVGKLNGVVKVDDQIKIR